MKKKSIPLNAVNKSSDKSQQVGNGDKKAQVGISAKPTGNNLQSSKPVSTPVELAKLREVATQINPLAQLILKISSGPKNTTIRIKNCGISVSRCPALYWRKSTKGILLWSKCWNTVLNTIINISKPFPPWRVPSRGNI